jgi:hypothetical protein
MPKHRTSTGSPLTTTPVIEYYNSSLGHFFITADTDEMAKLDSGSAAVFYIAIPAGDGSCAAGLMPVYRLYNDGQGGVPNHRYTTDVSVRAQAIKDGWVPEGFGPDVVQMCAPQ